MNEITYTYQYTVGAGLAPALPVASPPAPSGGQTALGIPPSPPGEGRGEVCALRSPLPALIKNCHLNPDHYNALMFEIGAKWLEKFCHRHFINGDEMYRDISQEASFTFWDWWKDNWANDDYSLLNLNMLTPGQPGYESMKECLIGDCLLEKQFYIIIYPLL